MGDPNFPQFRGNVKESEQPIFLYYKGNIDLLSIENKNITVIGLLNPVGDVEEREREKFISWEDFVRRTKASKTVIEKMKEHKILEGLEDSNQRKLF